MNKEIHRVKYHHYKTPLTNNIFTTCSLFNENNIIISRGVSICSLLDSFVKKEGRRRSYSRAIKAMHTEKNSQPINTYNRNDDCFIKRTLKVKSSEDITYFIEKITPELNSNNFHRAYRENNQIIRYEYNIPKNYPIMKASEFFKFKSEFKPVITPLIKEKLGEV